MAGRVEKSANSDDLKSSGESLAGSSPAAPTIKLRNGNILLYKQKLSPYWFARFKVDGKWVSRTTKETETTEASAKALYLCDGFVQAKTSKSFVKYTCRLGDIYAQNKLPTHKSYLQILTRWIEKFFAKYNIDEVDEDAIDAYYEWFERELGRCPAKGTINHHNVVLRAVFDLASRAKDITRGQIPKLTIKGRGRKFQKRPAFTLQQYKVMLKYLHDWENKGTSFTTVYKRKLLRYYVVMLAMTGMRPGREIDTLRWKDIRKWTAPDGIDYVEILIQHGKKGGRDIYASMWLKSWLDNLRTTTGKTHANDLVFCMPDGSPLKGLSEMFSKFLAEYGLSTNERGVSYTLYSLRHSYITWRIVYRRISYEVLADHCGTSVAMIEQYYKDLTPKAFVKDLA